ncbi:hypothetical protein [Bifidobacterium asteroides]|uniref:Lipoprotein n=1 Tax=Bifidobacterium asteroides TaxID=1684 RepID=A0A318MGB6_9BIFI|nr:hypothetical protein [Bifidobacterium asteroides]PXY82991.1 hypothetical protein DKK75_04675 [Bifidobacterium asteroides]
MVKKLASLLLAICASVSLAACGGQSSDAVQRLKAECSKASDAIQYNEKENSIMYMSELDSDTSSEALPGLSCITKTVGVTADELNDQVQDDGSGYLEKNGYSIGISSTGQNVTLNIEDQDK